MADQSTQDPAVTPDVTTATPVAEGSSPAPESSKDDANLDQSQGQGSTQEPSSSKPDSTDADLSVEELKTKYSESSKEARIRKEEAEQERAKVRELEQELLATVTESRETFEKYLDKKGLSPEERTNWLNYYDKELAPNQKPQATETGQPAQPQSPQLPQQPPSAPEDPIRRSWMKEMDAKAREKFEARQKASQEFMDTPENKELSKAALNAIWRYAEYLDEDKGLSPQEALQQARKYVVNIEESKDEGYVEGVRDFASGVSRGVSGSGSKSKGSAFTLGKRDQAFVDAHCAKHGLTGQAREEFERAYALKVQRDKD